MCKPDFDSEFDVGTSPHGLTADHKLPHQESHSLLSLDSLVDAFDLAEHSGSADEGAVAPSLQAMPEVYRTPKVRSCCQSIQAAAAGRLPKYHNLELTDCELLHLIASVEHVRYSDFKAIKKGLMVADDMKGSNSLWQKLQEVRALRMRNPGGVK
jgi:hypothetical protein